MSEASSSGKAVTPDGTNTATNSSKAVSGDQKEKSQQSTRFIIAMVPAKEKTPAATPTK
jgi:hypothetical protein